MPPNAAPKGRMAFLKLESSPISIHALFPCRQTKKRMPSENRLSILNLYQGDVMEKR